MASRLSPLLVLVLGSACLLACGDEEEKGLACPGTPCGGDPTGSWTLAEACLDDEEATRARTIDGCPGGRITTGVQYGGTITFEGAEARSELTARLTWDVRIPTSCLTTQGDPGQLCEAFEAQFRDSLLDPEEAAVPEARCSLGSTSCDCDIEVLLPLDFWSAPYEVDGESLVVDGEVNPFCVDGDTLYLNHPDGAQGMVFTR